MSAEAVSCKLSIVRSMQVLLRQPDAKQDDDRCRHIQMSACAGDAQGRCEEACEAGTSQAAYRRRAMAVSIRGAHSRVVCERSRRGGGPLHLLSDTG